MTRTFTRPCDYYDPRVAGPWPGEVGSFYVEGATPKDMVDPNYTVIAKFPKAALPPPR